MWDCEGRMAMGDAMPGVRGRRNGSGTTGPGLICARVT